MAGPAIEVEGLRKRYGDLSAVDNLSFRVEQGSVYGMLGPNGAGKTTAVECVIGLRQPDEGRIEVLGMAQGKETREIKARLGVQLQTTGLFPKLKVRETLEVYANLFPRSLPLDQVLAMVDLQEKQKAYVSTLSGGQRQRLCLALALVNDPDLIFLDEPTAAMDPASRRSVWEIVKNLRRMGKTILLTTHFMDEAAQLCDRVAVVDHGKIIAEGHPTDLVREHFSETAVEFQAVAGVELRSLEGLSGVARAEEDNGAVTLYSHDVPDTVAALFSFAREQGFRLDRFTVREATLEDLFLRLTGRKIRE